MSADTRRGFAEIVREIGESFLALVRAELDALLEDFGRSGRALGRALLLAGAAAAVLFWTLGLVLYLAIELLALALPRWGAVAIVLGVFALAAAILAIVARRRLNSIEPPAATVRRRLDESRAWWDRRVVAGEDEPVETPRLEIEEELP
jgi:hypothetical protein